MKVFIYALICPKDKNVKYIGWAKNPDKRKLGHIRESLKDTKTRKRAWIKGLYNENLLPELFVIDEVSYSEVEFWEQHYISLYRSWGYALYNLTLGGEVNKSVFEETREKLRQYNLGKTHSEETKIKMSEIKIGKLPPYLEAQQGKHTEEQIEKISKTWFKGESWNRGLTKETDERLQSLSNLRKNKTAEEIFGDDKAAVFKTKVSKAVKEQYNNNKEEFLKRYVKQKETYQNKTDEEKEQIKKKRSESLKKYGENKRNKHE